VTAGTAKPISKIGLGTWQFGSPEWNYGQRYAGEQARAIVRRAIDLGITLFDTAEIYGMQGRSVACRALVRGLSLRDPAAIRGFGHGERILGEALEDRGDAAFVATKFYPAVPFAAAPRQRAAASADRLGIGQIDLCQVHRPRNPAGQSAAIRAARALHTEGIVGEVGLSNGSLDDWRAAESALGARVLSNQLPYSLVNRSAEDGMLPFAETRGRVIIAHSPLARGLLSCRYDAANRPGNPARMADPLFLPENLARAGGLFAALREVADAHSATPAQIALAWVIRHEAVAAIPGAASVTQLESNAEAADITLAGDECLALESAAARFRPVLRGRPVRCRDPKTLVVSNTKGRGSC